MQRLAQVLNDVARTLKVQSVGFLEMMGTPPPQGLVWALPNKQVPSCLKENDIPLKAHIDKMLRVGPSGQSELTASCGITSQWLDGLTSIDGKSGALSKGTMRAIVKELQDVSADRWYCRISDPYHSYLLEYAEGRGCVLQSFFGQTTLDPSIQDLICEPEKYILERDTFFAALQIATIDVQFLDSALVEIAPSLIPDEDWLYEHPWQMAQHRLFHKLPWKLDTGEKEYQYRANTNPASASIIRTNIENYIKDTKGKWSEYFELGVKSALAALTQAAEELYGK
jgi:hypothetical protein